MNSDSITELATYMSKRLAAEHEAGVREGVTASGNGRLAEIIDQLGTHNIALLEFERLVRRLITCADNGYDTEVLHDIVEDARKAAGK